MTTATQRGREWEREREREREINRKVLVCFGGIGVPIATLSY
jgi:hypothetical protein